MQTVDSKKLARAEELRQKKLDKRDTKGNQPQNRYKSNEASASQVISKKAESGAGASVNTKDVRIDNFDISYGEKVLLRGANLSLVHGRRYGMVGRNGLGKSTLLKMISR